MDVKNPQNGGIGNSKNVLRKRFLTFLIGCIGVRVALVIIAYYLSSKYLRIMGLIALIPAIGFLYIYLTGSRETGHEVGGGKIWWNCLRPVHSLLYFLFAYNAILQNPMSWKFLALDVTIGFIAFIGHHYTEGNFQKII